jgi:hypothetical protein
VDEEADGVGYAVDGIDLSTLASPVEMRRPAPRPLQGHKYSSVGSREIAPEDVAAAFKGGLDNVDTRVFEASRDRSMTDAKVRDTAQTLADKSGEIVAIQERHASVSSDVSDLSALGGGFDARRASTLAMGDSQTAYFFPEDPNPPNWRPFSMHWAYVGTLVLLALALAAAQETACQISIQRKRDNHGLLEFTEPQEVSVLDYFTWKYMPTIVLLAYGILWMIVDFEVKRLEPFYQLSRKRGATARDSLNLDYITFLTYFVPFKALRSKQYAVVLSSTATLFAGSLAPILQSASMVMEPKGRDVPANVMKFVRIDPPWSRAVTAVLLLVAIQGALLMFQLHRRKSGLLSDPKGIAGIAAMATKSYILNDFKGLDRSSNQRIHNRLRTRGYSLYKSSLYQGEYIKSSEVVEEKEEHPHPVLMRLHAGIPFITYMVIVGILIPVFMFVPLFNHATEKLPWLMTALATIVKLLWGCLDMNLRVIEPYYILSLGNASPKVLTMDYTGTVPGWLTIKAAMEGQYLTALVGMGAILAEVLTVCVTSFSVDGHKFVSPGGKLDDDERSGQSTDQTFRSFWVSFALSLSILLYLITTSSFVYLKRSHKFLPRQPGSIASVMAYIHQSRMLLDFVGTERMSSKEMERHLEGLGKKYGLGWFVGMDGVEHLGVDQEPLRQRYRWGVDFTEAHLSGREVGGWENY